MKQKTCQRNSWFFIATQGFLRRKRFFFSLAWLFIFFKRFMRGFSFNNNLFGYGDNNAWFKRNISVKLVKPDTARPTPDRRPDLNGFISQEFLNC